LSKSLGENTGVVPSTGNAANTELHIKADKLIRALSRKEND
jgi:hypothetical protein